MGKWVASIGMEVHAELLTRSKMFCRCPVAFGGEPNTRTCPVCLGLPGALPVPNEAAIELVLKTALALNCQIAMHSIFHRKNYFYPDLPKGYQISQYGETNPLGYNGYLDIPTKEGRTKRIKIRRVHLEEDTGKLTHLPGGGSGVDYNRAGVPLMEIVTEFPPDLTSPDEAKEYISQLRMILIYIGSCDGKMEEGSLRCEPNTSVRPEGSVDYGTKTELKNLNSFRAVQLGVQFEVKRQIDALESGRPVLQETRGWNENTETSFPMRLKEAENDYRYFADPDLLPMVFPESYIEQLRSNLPELPLAKWNRYQSDWGLNQKHADQLVAEREWAEFFEDAVTIGGDPRSICNWMIADFAAMLNESGTSPRQSLIKPEHLVELTQLIADGRINGKIGKEVFAESFKTGNMPSSIVEAKGLTQVSDAGEIEAATLRVLSENQGTVAKYKSGQVSVKGFLVGLVMKEGKGRFNPPMVQESVQKALDS
jgi:aspartyl-tRNA(Asn)/glutamyl-tRNA(Gln) amidotransferase subunit B